MERDKSTIFMSLSGVNFNSHAHVERDKFIICSSMVSGISTHTLTWSVTDFLRYAIGKIKISTHTLTWSVTLEKNIQCNHLQISTHTLTWSVTCQNVTIIKMRIFQLTRSRGAWRYYTWTVLMWTYFNSHAHVERDFGIFRQQGSNWKFQLTRSRGAWRA